MRLLRYQDLPITPWKNGGGVTREIASARDAGKGAGFLWRVSIATVSASGPFSRFDNVDRTIAVLSGNGICLSHPDGTTELTTTTQPYAFAGQTSIHADVIDGETTDLNAMSLRDTYRHEMQMHLVSSETSVRTRAEQSILVCGGPMTISYQGRRLDVAAFDAVADVAAGSVLELSAPNPTPSYLIAFFPVD